MGKLNGRKGISKNKEQVDAAAARAAAAELAQLASERQRQEPRADGTPMAPTHVPQKLGKGGGARQKVDLDAVSPRSKAKIEKQRVWNAARYAKTRVAVTEVSEAVLADPTLICILIRPIAMYAYIADACTVSTYIDGLCGLHCTCDLYISGVVCPVRMASWRRVLRPFWHLGIFYSFF